MTTEQLADLIADRVRAEVRRLILAGCQGTVVDLPELGEVIVIERESAR